MSTPEISPCQETLGMLLMDTGRHLTSQMKPVFDAGSLRWRHLELLRLLEEQDSTTQQRLVEALGVDPSVLVGLLNDLERDALIQRIRDPKDRRRHLVEISAKGRAVRQQVSQEVAIAERVALDCLSPTDQQTLRRLLLAVRNQMSSTVQACTGAHAEIASEIPSENPLDIPVEPCAESA